MKSCAGHGDDLARVVGGVGEACRINSFSEETPVVTDEGAIPIKDVDVGDRVLAWDELTETTDYTSSPPRSRMSMPRLSS